jgi:hypothetical protein
MPEKSPFSFETYVVDQLEKLNAKMDGLNATFVPREEIMLMKKESDGRLADTEKKIATAQRETVALITQLRKDSEAANDELKKRLNQESESRTWRNRMLIVAIVSAVFIALGSLIVSLLAHRIVGG